MRGDGAAPSQKPGCAPRDAAAPTSEAASVMPRQTARQATFDPSMTDPPPSATTRSASCARSSSARASTSSSGECARMVAKTPARRSPIAAFAAAARAPPASERVVTSTMRAASPISRGSASPIEAP